ncbi:unnamed protein product [Mycena citricolor]|uniref:histidine kinase n=1 Tax=Mycena citricolor TaxID=2018698 RepID=A0AAD2GSZ6_9AGAR|nr:unnamed protein product [Mycena citricolor]
MAASYPSGSGLDDELITQWTGFLQDYAKGEDRPRPPALLPPHASVHPPSGSNLSLPAFDVPLYPPGKISKDTARVIAEFYSQYGFLPPPRAEEECLRNQVIELYNLFRPDQVEHFHRCSSLLHAFFPIAPVVTINLFHNDFQIVVSKAGDFPLRQGENLLTEISICGHVILKKDRSIIEMLEVSKDWRFLGNPWCTAESLPLKGYVGIPLSLNVDPSDPNNHQVVNVGVLALLSQTPFPPLLDSQRKVLSELSAILSIQLRSTWEVWSRNKETQLRNAVSTLLEKALVQENTDVVTTPGAAMAEPPVQGSIRSMTPQPSVEKGKSTTKTIFSDAAEQLRTLLEVDFAVIIDLTAIHVTHTRSSFKSSHKWAADTSEARIQKRLAQQILGSSMSAMPNAPDLRENFSTIKAMDAIIQFLEKYTESERSIFLNGEGFPKSGLEGLLECPPLPLAGLAAPGLPPAGRGAHHSGGVSAMAHIALPLFMSQRPNLLIVVASSTPYFAFTSANVTFVRNIGSILCARLGLDAIVQADAAKTAFHLDLIRDSYKAGEISGVPTLLSSAEHCGTALRDIVDDVLDYGKMAMTSPAAASPETKQHLHSQIDLLYVTVETTKSCYLRRLLGLRARGELAPSDRKGQVKLFVKHELRSNWLVNMDVPGFVRILNNLITNSLKYTSEGTITVSLSLELEPNLKPCAIVQVQDTGLGMGSAFLDRMFEPFTQADSFSPGAGLVEKGLHITKAIVERMNGKISVHSRPGSGSTFTVTLPIEDPSFHSENTTNKLETVEISTSPKNDSPPSIPPPMPAKPEANVVDPSSHLTILVVDDNAISRKLLVAMLKRMNVTAHQAEDGLVALEVFQAVKPHVVWTDISMPRMDGVTAAKEMRKVERARGWPPCYIVAITGLGLSDEQIRREALHGPAALDAWLIKGQTNIKSLKDSLDVVRQRMRANLGESL